MNKAMRYPPLVSNVPHLLHGGDYNPEQWMVEPVETLGLSSVETTIPAIWQDDMRLAEGAGINTFTIGMFSWSDLEPVEGEYHFEWLDRVMDLCAEHGITVMLGTPSGARPPWLNKKYPEVLRVNANRVRNLPGFRHNHCLSSPVYREKVQAINTALAERYKGHKALGMWHISNEYGGDCHCPICQERFRDWLKKRYGSLDALNAAWWTHFWSHRYSSWEEIESPSELGDTCVLGLNLAWRRFTSDQYIDFYRWETAPLKKITPDVPCTTNFMGTYLGFDQFALAREMDAVSWDNYPNWRGTEEDAWEGMRVSFVHDLNRSLKGKPFMMMESSPSATNWQSVSKLRAPGMHALQSLQAVAHGSDSVQYFQFRKGRGGSEMYHGAVVGHEGSERAPRTRVYREVAELGARLKTLDGVVGCSTPAEVALVYDWENAWAIDDARGFLQKNTAYDRTVLEHYQAFWAQAVPVDIIDSTCSLDGYRLVVAPMLYMLRGDFAERIAAFVRAGGTFVATYISGYVDSEALAFQGGLPGPLQETLGVWVEEIDSLYSDMSNSFSWKGKSYKVKDFCDLLHLEGAEALATYNSNFYKGLPALTVNHYGNGAAYYIAARSTGDFLSDFYRHLVDESSVVRVLDGPLPPGVTAQLRSDGTTDYVFLLNFSPHSVSIDTGFAGVKALEPWEVAILERH